MKIGIIYAAMIFGICILLTLFRDNILEMLHIEASIDAAYVIGVVTGMLVMTMFDLIDWRY